MNSKPFICKRFNFFKSRLSTNAYIGIRRLLIVLATVLLSAVRITTTWAQSTSAASGSIRGSIRSLSGSPLSDINITLQGTLLGTATDREGKFTMRQVPTGTYTLLATGVGYSASRQNIAVLPGKATVLTLQIDETTHGLAEVVVAGLKEKTYVEPIIESATRTQTPLQDIPQAIQVVSAQVLQEQQVYRLSDAFKNVAGITDQSDFNYVNIRGFTTSSANFMVNGQRNGYASLDQSPQLPYAERIEVLKGPSSVLYGNGAIGGTINIVTKKPKRDFYTDASLTVGSFGLTRLQGDVTGSLNQAQTLLGLVNVGLENGGSFYDGFKTRSIVLTPVFTWHISPQTELTSTTILRSANETAPSTGIPIIGPSNNLFAAPNTFRYAASDGAYKSQSIQEQLSLTHRFTADLSATIWYNVARRSLDARIYQPGGYSPSIDSISRFLQVYQGRERGSALNAYLNYRLTTGKITHQLVIGFDYNSYASNYPVGFSYYSDYINLNKPDYTPLSTAGKTPDYYQSDEENYGPTRTVGGYVQDQLTITPKLKALLALRYDDYRYTYYGRFSGSPSRDTSSATALVPKVGIVYQPISPVSIYGSYSEGFQPQSSNGRLAGGPFPPLRAQQLELGFKGAFLGQRLVPTIAIYTIQQQNVLKPDPTDPASIRQLTTGQVTSRGLELTLTGLLAPNWNVLANYAKNKTYTSRSTDPEEVGQEFGDTPHDAVSAWTTYRLKGLKIGLGYRYYSDKQVYGISFPGYLVVDALVSYQYKTIDLSLNVNNLTNKRYAIGTFGTTYSFPGAPRSVLISLRYNAW